MKHKFRGSDYKIIASVNYYSRRNRTCKHTFLEHEILIGKVKKLTKNGVNQFDFWEDSTIIPQIYTIDINENIVSSV